MVLASYHAASQVDWWKSLSTDFSDDSEVYDVGLSAIRGFSGMYVILQILYGIDIVHYNL